MKLEKNSLTPKKPIHELIVEALEADREEMKGVYLKDSNFKVGTWEAGYYRGICQCLMTVKSIIKEENLNKTREKLP